MTTESAGRNLGAMAEIAVIKKTVEEVPHFFDFTKNDFVGDCPGMAKLDYDPFQDKQPEDVVRTEIIARKLILHAQLKGEAAINVRPGVCIKVDGHDFAVSESNIHIDTENEQDSTAEVQGEAFLTNPEPLKALAQLRKSMAEK